MKRVLGLALLLSAAPLQSQECARTEDFTVVADSARRIAGRFGRLGPLVDGDRVREYEIDFSPDTLSMIWMRVGVSRNSIYLSYGEVGEPNKYYADRNADGALDAVAIVRGPPSKQELISDMFSTSTFSASEALKSPGPRWGTLALAYFGAHSAGFDFVNGDRFPINSDVMRQEQAAYLTLLSHGAGFGNNTCVNVSAKALSSNGRKY